MYYKMLEISHLKYTLDLYTTDPNIPEEIYNIIKIRLPHEFELKDIKKAMKHLKLYKLYENMQYIYLKLSNKSIPHLDNETREKIIKLYIVYYNVYKYKFPHKSHLSMFYVISKILYLINASDELKECFKHNNKNYIKLSEQNKLWDNLELFKTIQSKL
jgi:hypothetical protein